MFKLPVFFSLSLCFFAPFIEFPLFFADVSPRNEKTHRAYGCGYCSAHTAGLGTIWRGDRVFLAKNIAAMAPQPDPTIFSPQELAVINICKKLGPLPSRVASEDIKGLASVFSEKAQEAVINSATVMGFLNRFMWVV